MPAATPPPPVVAAVTLANVVVFKAGVGTPGGGDAPAPASGDALGDFLKSARRRHRKIGVVRDPARTLRDGVPTVFTFTRDVSQPATGALPAVRTVAESVTVSARLAPGGAIRLLLTRRDAPATDARWRGPLPPPADAIVSETLRTVRPGDSVLLDTFAWPGGVVSYAFAVVSAPAAR